MGLTKPKGQHSELKYYMPKFVKFETLFTDKPTKKTLINIDASTKSQPFYANLNKSLWLEKILAQIVALINI